MLGSLIATLEGVVDLVTGVWSVKWKGYGERKTEAVDVRHCTGSLKVLLRSLGSSWEVGLSTIEK